MRPLPKKSVTLIELLICIALLDMVVLGFYGMNLFGHYHLIGASKRAQLQNAVTLVLDHMSKQISKGIGDANIEAVNITIGPPLGIRIWSDTNRDGVLNTASGEDQQISYWFSSGEHEIRYSEVKGCEPFVSSGSCDYETFGKKFTALTPDYQGNYLNISLSGCWNPGGTPPNTCGSMDNPSVTMNTTVRLSAVSVF